MRCVLEIGTFVYRRSCYVTQRKFAITTTKGLNTTIAFFAKTVSTFVKTKVLTEFAIGTLGFSVSRTVKL